MPHLLFRPGMEGLQSVEGPVGSLEEGNNAGALKAMEEGRAFVPASFEGDLSSPALWDSEDERAMGLRPVPQRPGEAAKEKQS